MLVELKGRCGPDSYASPTIAGLSLQRLSLCVERRYTVDDETFSIHAQDGMGEVWIGHVLYPNRVMAGLQSPPWEEVNDVLERLLDGLDRAVLAAQGRRASVVRWADLVDAAGIGDWLAQVDARNEEVMGHE